ncbi:hypothetical protein [Streptomyces griseus]|uniref:hypothetical protein n=1 Tax=Streptomyces griseus TaxID=1911 RepID=UPI001EF31C02
MPTTLPLPHGTRRGIRRFSVSAALAVCTAADGDVANSILADLTISNVAAAGLDVFSGTAGVLPKGGLDSADLSGPSGVLGCPTVRGQAVARTNTDPENNWAPAQSSGIGVESCWEAEE